MTIDLQWKERGGGGMKTDLVDEIFQRALTGQKLFKDRSAVRTDYIPDKLPFRDEQVSTLAQALAPSLHGSRGSNLFLYGKTGTGKTVVVKYLLKRLEKTAAENRVSLRFSYINMRVAGTEYRVLYDFGGSLNVDIPFTGLSISESFSRILAKIEADGTGAIMVLDEVDYLVKNYGDDNLLYELTRSNERLTSGFISIIGISNDLKFKEFLDPRILSSLGEEEIVFSPYTAEELGTILRQRAQAAFEPDVVSNAAINLCAALAGAEHGDARRAVDTLRVAGEVAEREGSTTVEEEHVRIAIQRIEEDRLSEALRSLPLQAKLLTLAALSGAGSTGEVYGRYSSLCKKLGMGALTQRRVSGILAELDLLGVVSTQVVNQGRYGRTKRIKTLIPREAVDGIFREDPVVGPLLAPG